MRTEPGRKRYKLKVLPTSYADTVVGNKRNKLFTNIYKLPLAKNV